MEKYIQASEWKNGQKWYHYTQRMRYPTALENADKEQYQNALQLLGAERQYNDDATLVGYQIS